MQTFTSITCLHVLFVPFRGLLIFKTLIIPICSLGTRVGNYSVVPYSVDDADFRISQRLHAFSAAKQVLWQEQLKSFCRPSTSLRQEYKQINNVGAQLLGELQAPTGSNNVAVRGTRCSRR